MGNPQDGNSSSNLQQLQDDRPVEDQVGVDNLQEGNSNSINLQQLQGDRPADVEEQISNDVDNVADQHQSSTPVDNSNDHNSEQMINSVSQQQGISHSVNDDADWVTVHSTNTVDTVMEDSFQLYSSPVFQENVALSNADNTVVNQDLKNPDNFVVETPYDTHEMPDVVKNDMRIMSKFWVAAEEAEVNEGMGISN